MPAETHTHRGPYSRDDIRAIVVACLGEILEIDDSTIKDSDSFADDLHADSIALFEMIDMLNDEFGERTLGLGEELDDLQGFELVSDAVDYVVAQLA